MQVQPYLFFGGRCEEALVFYCNALGVQQSFVFAMRYKDAPPDAHAGGQPLPPEWEDKIMHANLTLGGMQFMVSDGMPGDVNQQYAGFSLSVSASSVEEGQRVFDALATEGSITMPYQKTFWAEGFGMLVDRFGVPWMVNCDTDSPLTV